MEKTEGASKPVMVRVPQPMYRRLQEIARDEATSVATVLRRLAAERMGQIESERRERGMRDYRGPVSYQVRREPAWEDDDRAQARIDRALEQAGTVPTFSYPEACLIYDACRSTFFGYDGQYDEAHYAVHATVQDASDAEGLGRKWGVDVPALLARLRALPGADLEALAIALDREKGVGDFQHKTEEEAEAADTRSLSETLVAIGLVTEDEAQRAK